MIRMITKNTCLLSLCLYTVCIFAAEHTTSLKPLFTCEEKNQQFRLLRWWQVSNTRILASQDLTSSEHANMAKALDENMTAELERLKKVQEGNMHFNVGFMLRKIPSLIPTTPLSPRKLAALKEEIATTMREDQKILMHFQHIEQQVSIERDFPPAFESPRIVPQNNHNVRCRAKSSAFCRN